jgi:hypothetical protein
VRPACADGVALLCATALSLADKGTSRSKARAVPARTVIFRNRGRAGDMGLDRRYAGSLNGIGLSAGISARNVFSVIEISA